MCICNIYIAILSFGTNSIYRIVLVHATLDKKHAKHSGIQHWSFLEAVRQRRNLWQNKKMTPMIEILIDLTFNSKTGWPSPRTNCESGEAGPTKELDSRQKIIDPGNTFDPTSHGGAASRRLKRLEKIYDTQIIYLEIITLPIQKLTNLTSSFSIKSRSSRQRKRKKRYSPSS